MLRALALLAGLVALTGCGGAAPCRSMAPGAIGGGDGAPIAASYDYRWVVLREARADTDGDGRVALEWYEHGHGGELAGDRLGTYLVRESGPGRQIERYVGSSRDGRFVYFVDEGRFVGLDASTWRETPIAPAPAPLPWPAHGALWIGEDAAAVREDGRLVFTSDRARVESWDPATGRLGLVGAHRGRIVRLSALGGWVVTELVSEGDSELPYVELSSIRFACGGLGTCGGPSRTISLVHLDAGGPVLAAGGVGGHPARLGLGPRARGERPRAATLARPHPLLPGAKLSCLVQRVGSPARRGALRPGRLVPRDPV